MKKNNKKAKRSAKSPPLPATSPSGSYKQMHDDLRAAAHQAMSGLGSMLLNRAILGFVSGSFLGDGAVSLSLAPPAWAIVDTLVKTGLYGKNREEVVRRFVEEKLREFVERPKLSSEPRPPLPGKPWTVEWSGESLASGNTSLTQMLIGVSLFRAEQIEIDWAPRSSSLSRPPVIVVELAAVREGKKTASTAPVSGRPVGIIYKEGVAKCNVMFQRADDVVLRVHNSSKETVRCNVKISGRAVL